MGISKTSTSVKTSAFTIVELLIVIVVIGILAAITIVAFNGVQQKARTATLQSDLKNAATQIGIIYADTGVYPVDIPDLKKSDSTILHYAYISNSSYCLSGTDSSSSTWYRISNTEGVRTGACPTGGTYWVAKNPAVNTQAAAPSGGYTSGVTLAAIYQTPAGTTNIVGATNDVYIKIAQANPSSVSGLAGDGTTWALNNAVPSTSPNRMIVSRAPTVARSTLNGTQFSTTYTYPTLTLPIIVYSTPTVAAIWPYPMSYQEQQGALAWLEQYAN